MGCTTTSLPLSGEESGHRIERFSFGWLFRVEVEF
jgi:hypothetical protein